MKTKNNREDKFVHTEKNQRKGNFKLDKRKVRPVEMMIKNKTQSNVVFFDDNL